MPVWKGTIAEHIEKHKENDDIAIVADGQAITYRRYFTECAMRANFARKTTGKFHPHIGVMLENTPEFLYWLGACAISRSTFVALNSTHRGSELKSQVTHTECDLVLTEKSSYDLLVDAGVDVGIVDRVDTSVYLSAISLFEPTFEVSGVFPSDKFLLIFTSGTSGSPKAVVTTQGRLEFVGQAISGLLQFTKDERCYVAMPLFHSNSIFSSWAPALVAGARVVLRRKFSASNFMSDIRKHEITYFNYVGRPLTYILETPESSDDKNHCVRIGFGNEAPPADLKRFTERFNIPLMDSYGQTEMGATILRVPDMPDGALGIAMNDATKVMKRETMFECDRAKFDEFGRLTNPEEAIGEIVNTGETSFEGYWKNDQAMRERTENGYYWTGDLAYRDEAGFFYFAGRTTDWARVDGENFSTAIVDKILSRFEDFFLVACYAIPDDRVGDKLVAAAQMRANTNFDPDKFADFLSSQSDISPKWLPSVLRLVEDMPMTESNKIMKRTLRDSHGDGNLVSLTKSGSAK